MAEQEQSIKGERRERKDAQRNLERVLQAARELFAEQGVEVTIEMVARRAGVGIGTVYRRFPSKEHLFAAASKAACSDTQRCLIEATEAASDPIGKLRAMVSAHVQRSAKWATLLELRAAPSAEQQRQLYATMHHMLQHVILEGQRQGLMRQGDPIVLAALCLEVLHPRAIHHLLHVTGGNIDAVADHVVRFILNGLGGRVEREAGK